MHIPENYLSPGTCAVLTAAMAPVWYMSLQKVKKELPPEKLPLLGVAAAFSFLAMLVNSALPGGRALHSVGATRYSSGTEVSLPSAPTASTWRSCCPLQATMPSAC